MKDKALPLRIKYQQLERIRSVQRVSVVSGVLNNPYMQCNLVVWLFKKPEVMGLNHSGGEGGAKVLQIMEIKWCNR